MTCVYSRVVTYPSDNIPEGICAALCDDTLLPPECVPEPEAWVLGVVALLCVAALRAASPSAGTW